MKWLIASDIHGSAYYCQKLFERYEAEKADRMILLGDVLYHGPRNDLPRDYAPKEVIKILNGIKNEVFSVCGNCDSAVDQMVLEFPVLAEYSVLETDGRLIFLTHGHIYNEEKPLPMKKGDILLSGHTHVPKCTKKDGLVFMNPGSVSIPKENSPHSYMTLENGAFLWKDLDGEIYHEESFKETLK